ncbi:MAG: cell division protein FtsZ [Candidatus Bacteroides intestinipullorum]|uniref:Cell division protein FtsZ n=1 Tax=Candidatus Bacteroides intestinipullorum TaxID=2838471 RepID=A0A9E2KGS7_9BACE|nr:cell division protein FtsZ [Candidatus Bacteroides intestinipullorum]
MDDRVQFDFPTDSPKIIKVIGVGGGGGNAVNHMYREGIHEVAFVVCNTDRKALEESPVPVKLQLGHEGLGAGNRPSKAKEATEESIEEVKNMLNDGTKMVFITAGMGGGTGTGAAPTIAHITKEMDILTVGIVTIPFRWEGDKKIDQALDGVEEISKNVDALLVINNEKLGEIYPDLSVKNAFAKANDTLLVAAKSIAEIITMRGIINLDFNDVKTVMKDGGVAIMSTGFGEGENRVSKAIEQARHSPLLNNNDIFNSKKVLLNISYSPDHELMMSEMDEVDDFMSHFNRDFETKFGMAEDPELGEQVKITLLATGFGIQDIHMKEMDQRIEQRSLEEQKRLAELEEKEEERRKRRETYYGKDTRAKYQPTRRRHIYLFAPEDLDNADIVALVEESPTYRRDKTTLNAIRTKAEEGRNAALAVGTQQGEDEGIITF